MAKRTNWGAPPAPQDVAEQMNSVMKLEEDVAEAIEAEGVARRERHRRQEFLKTAREELGRMLKASPILDNSDFRVVHIDDRPEFRSLFVDDIRGGVA